MVIPLIIQCRQARSADRRIPEIVDQVYDRQGAGSAYPCMFIMHYTCNAWRETHTRTHKCTHKCTHARTRARTNAHTHSTAQTHTRAHSTSHKAHTRSRTSCTRATCMQRACTWCNVWLCMVPGRHTPFGCLHMLHFWRPAHACAVNTQVTLRWLLEPVLQTRSGESLHAWRVLPSKCCLHYREPIYKPICRTCL